MVKLNKDKFSQGEKDSIQKKFGKRLAEIRKGKDITQENLSFEIGVDRTYISYLERGKRNPSLYILSKMAKALSVPLKELTDL